MPQSARRLSCIAWLLPLMTLPACQRAGTSPARDLSTGLDILTTEPPLAAEERAPHDASSAANAAPSNLDSLESRIAQSALDLDDIFKAQADSGAVQPSPNRGARSRAVPSPTIASASENSAEATPAFGLDSSASNSPALLDDEATTDDPKPNPSGPSNTTPSKPTSGDGKLAIVAAQFASTLRHRDNPNAKPIPDALVLTTLESLQPGVMGELDKPESAISKTLSREDRRELLAARDRVASNPEAKTIASDSLSRTLQSFAPPAALQIPKAAFCTRVQGFGKYDPVFTDTFLVGKPIRTLVYTELDGFTTRSARAGDPGMSAIDPPKHAVELSQSLTLYHDPSGLVAWQRPPQTVIEPCKTKRRDFFLVQRLDLPATLSIGKYNLKVRVTDLTSGSEAEAILPINVVADPALVRR